MNSDYENVCNACNATDSYKILGILTTFGSHCCIYLDNNTHVL